MKTITLSNGQNLNFVFSVLETLAVNGYTDSMIVRKGYGSCKDKSGNTVQFEYNF